MFVEQKLKETRETNLDGKETCMLWRIGGHPPVPRRLPPEHLTACEPWYISVLELQGTVGSPRAQNMFFLLCCHTFSEFSRGLDEIIYNLLPSLNIKMELFGAGIVY